MIGIELQVKVAGGMLQYRHDYIYSTWQRVMTMKKCPSCLAELHEAALVCPYCGDDLMVTVPMRVLERQKAREQAKKKSSVIALIMIVSTITLLVASLAAILILLWNSY